MKITELTPEPQILSEMARRLARVRKQQGYTQDALAALAGIGVATLRRIEDGQDSQFSSWLKVLRALGMVQSMDALLPENFRSPMAEVNAATGKRRYSSAAESNAGPSIWQDETPSR